MAYSRNQRVRNKQGTKNPEKLVIEGFYNHKDRRKSSVKRLYDLFETTSTSPDAQKIARLKEENERLKRQNACLTERIEKLE